MKNGKMGNEGRRAILQQHRGFSEAFCGPSALVLWGHLDIFPKQLLNFVKLTSKKNPLCQGKTGFSLGLKTLKELSDGSKYTKNQ